MEEITKQLLEDLYIKQKKTIRELKELLGVSNKRILRLLKEYRITLPLEQIMQNRADRSNEKYGCIPQRLESIRGKISKGVKEKFSTGIPQNKSKQTCLEKYGVDNFAKTKEWKKKYENTCLEKYGVNHYSQTDKFKDDRYSTMTKNNSFVVGGVSKKEEQAYQMLLERFHKSDIIRQYRNPLYPFKCDFYIKSKDLYIEYNGSHYHGHCVYDPTSEVHQKLVQKWREKAQGVKESQWNRMIEVWTREDPLKRRIAKENNLNWKEFFSLEELDQWLENTISN